MLKYNKNKKSIASYNGWLTHCNSIKQIKENDFIFLPENQRRKALAFSRIQSIVNFFNGNWIPDWSNYSEYKWYPYYTINGSGGLVFDCSNCSSCSFFAEVGFYKSQEISDFCGKVLINEYKELR